ncbi:hypothetical protein CcCBS67573_g02774 [Chytriomyces confervae]|uniref:AB hydrolase-1 domain-containing protein n=1 Tax=Chytriomyces confervae TaxID=246404 RepID=A0A507FKM1_9FUNG|nr:hypothetical protein HDU80_005204 [Chytriomyces hyalinus]TPX75978.1 hypothetical protein CcCBS67573_g02774 [Chytriomyces confervae]
MTNAVETESKPSATAAPADGAYAYVGSSRLKSPIKLWHRIHGSGPIKVIFIMGLNITHQSWDYQYNYFGSLPEFSCLVFDNRGVGFSDAPPGRYTTKEMAKDTLELLDHVNWKSKVHVVGISMGGMVSLELSLLAPNRLASLTLTSTHAGDLIPPLGAIVQVPKLMLTKDPHVKIAGLRDLIFPPHWQNKPSDVVEGKTNKEVITDVLIRRAVATPLQTPGGAIGQLLAVISHRVGPARLQGIVDSQIPVLVCTGTWDNLVNPQNSKYLAKMLQPRVYRVFEGAGHALTTEFSLEYNAMLKSFIEDVENGRDVSSPRL